MKYYDIELAYKNGITALHMGGEFMDNNFFREKDVMENDYSLPTLQGKKEIVELKDCSISANDKLYAVRFSDGGLFLTEDELNAGICE